MADKKISELPDDLTFLSSGDLFAIVDVSDGVTKQITFSEIMASPGEIGGTNPAPATFDTLTFDSGGATISIFSTDGTLSANSDTRVPTQKAVKTYVDSIAPQGENVRRISSDTTAVANDVLLVDTTNGDVTIEMLDTTDGRIVFKKISNDSNSVIISGPSTIDGQAQFTITTQYQSYNILVDNSEFFVI